MPTLVPLFAWCYLPAADGRPEAPVLTVERTIVSSWATTWRTTSGGCSRARPRAGAPPLRVPFWSDLTALVDPTGRGLMDPARSPGTR